MEGRSVPGTAAARPLVHVQVVDQPIGLVQGLRVVPHKVAARRAQVWTDILERTSSPLATEGNVKDDLVVVEVPFAAGWAEVEARVGHAPPFGPRRSAGLQIRRHSPPRKEPRPHAVRVPLRSDHAAPGCVEGRASSALAIQDAAACVRVLERVLDGAVSARGAVLARQPPPRKRALAHSLHGTALRRVQRRLVLCRVVRRLQNVDLAAVGPSGSA
mmetsp:Transcript_76315/g.202668  ORF Transcript_76315/g.202668 Transcript_76315/m.202668 type:complete len:216 (+) Transcript_76315:260-907(+)